MKKIIPVNFRPMCEEESRDIKLIHSTYRGLKINRNSGVDISKNLNILNKDIIDGVIKKIPLSKWRAKQLGIEIVKKD